MTIFDDQQLYNIYTDFLLNTKTHHMFYVRILLVMPGSTPSMYHSSNKKLLSFQFSVWKISQKDLPNVSRPKASFGAKFS